MQGILLLASNATQCGMLADMQRVRFRQCECMAERQSAKGRARKFGLTHILLRGWRVRLHDYLHAFLSRFWSVGRSSEGAVSLQVGQGYSQIPRQDVLCLVCRPYRPLVGRDVCVVACFRALRRLTCPVGWAGWLACEGLTGQPFEVVVRFGFVVGRCVVLLCCVVSPDRV
jgi:hypothetical protein